MMNTATDFIFYQIFGLFQSSVYKIYSTTNNGCIRDFVDTFITCNVRLLH